MNIPHLRTILWFLLPGCILLAGLLSLSNPHNGLSQSLSLLALHTIALLCWAWLSLRLLGFRKRFEAFMRRLVAGDYETGMRISAQCQDELHALEQLANKLSDRLRTYDALRVNRISMLARSLDLVLRQTHESFATANPTKQTVQFNPAAQQQLGIPEKTWTFDAILKPEPNAAFARLMQQALDKADTHPSGACQLLLPGMTTPVTFQAHFIPLRDNEEAVQFCLIALDPPANKT